LTATPHAGDQNTPAASSGTAARPSSYARRRQDAVET
jgi:hypothetical protein